MNVIFTCGGTAGHIYPAISVANLLKQRHPDARILFVGAENAMETRLVPREGYEIRTVKVSNLRHSVSLKAISHNAKALSNLLTARKQAKQIIGEFKPDIVVGTGGYASYPITSEAADMDIPTAVHESNAVPGWTTRMLASRVDNLLVCFEESKKYYSKAKNIVLVGTPVRGDFIGRDKTSCRRELGLDDTTPLVLSFWGSLGAREMNRMILDCFELEASDDQPFRHIHACGKAAFEHMSGELETRGIRQHKDRELREFIFDMPLLMNAADLVLCRAGASTLAELCATGTPSILIPSPNVTNNHQNKNALVLGAAGAAVRIPESECNGNILYTNIARLLADKQACKAMSVCASNLAVIDASERIYQVIMRHISSRKS